MILAHLQKTFFVLPSYHLQTVDWPKMDQSADLAADAADAQAYGPEYFKVSKI